MPDDPELVGEPVVPGAEEELHREPVPQDVAAGKAGEGPVHQHRAPVGDAPAHDVRGPASARAGGGSLLHDLSSHRGCLVQRARVRRVDNANDGTIGYGESLHAGGAAAAQRDLAIRIGKTVR